MSNCKITVTGIVLYSKREGYRIYGNGHEGIFAWYLDGELDIKKGERATVTGDFDYDCFDAPAGERLYIRNPKVVTLIEEPS